MGSTSPSPLMAKVTSVPSETTWPQRSRTVAVMVEVSPPTGIRAGCAAMAMVWGTSGATVVTA